MGQVYEAEETESGRRVAIKILSRGLGDDEERERFLREGQLAASLSHPNVVYVFGTSEIQGFPVIAMELAPGGTLKDLVEPGRPIPVVKVVDAVLQVIAGLDAAAAIGIIDQSANLHRFNQPAVLSSAIGITVGGAAAFVAVLGLIGAFLARGGFVLRMLGAAVVTADGQDVARLRALLRALIAWSPVAIWLVLLKLTPEIQQSTIATALLFMLVPAMLIAGGTYAWLHPSRGIQDRIAGTWIVPR